MDIDSGKNNIIVTRGGRPRKSENLRKNEWREETITKARVSPNVLKSLQPCLLNQNLDVLKNCLKNTNSSQKKDKINGLADVLTFLLAGEICENGTEQESSFMIFDGALEIFLGYQRNHTVNSLDRNVKRQFLLALLNQKYGLCVFVWYSQTQNKTFVLARPDNVDLTSFLQHIGASVAKWLAHLPFTSEAAGSSLSENFLNATRTQSSCEKSKSQRSAESRGFPPGTPVSSNRES